ncbi:MAG: hypothetical protein ACM3ZA_08145 [Bacillota bacterium]
MVPRLAHGNVSGRLGVWTFRPAYFAELRLCPLERAAGSVPSPVPPAPPDLVSEWHLEGYGAVRVEPNGTLNLNRYLPMSSGPALLKRELTVGQEGKVDLRFGFSDELSLRVDGAVVFSGSHRFSGFPSRETRGYIEPDSHRLSLDLAPGRHELTAEVAAREPFGWGIALGCIP